eukprot:SAG11_NODE_5936_length_1430_cov_1.051089_2_plen_94_part_00
MKFAMIRDEFNHANAKAQFQVDTVRHYDRHLTNINDLAQVRARTISVFPVFSACLFHTVRPYAKNPMCSRRSTATRTRSATTSATTSTTSRTA